MLLAFVLILFLSIYGYFRYCYTYWKQIGVPQLNPTFPFGDMASVIFRKQNMGDKIRKIYNESRQKGYHYVGLYFFSRKAFLPLDPGLIKNILGKDFHHFSDRGIHYDEARDPLSAHLFSIAGPKWKNLRAKLTPAYSPGKLKFMFETIFKCGQEMNDILKEMSEAVNEIEIKEILARYSTDVIGCCAFGLECNSMRNKDAEFRAMGKRAFTQTLGDLLKMVVIRSFPSLAKLFGFGVFSGDVTRFFQKVVKETIEYRENNNVERKDFMQLLVQLKNNGKIDEDDQLESSKKPFFLPEPGTTLSIDEAAAQAFIFFLAGFETTSTTTSFALFEMSLHKHVQDKARQEVMKVLERYQGNLNYEVMMELKYLDMVINETMRKYPPAPVFLRKCTERYPIPGLTNSYIEKGQSVLIPCYGLHRDPEYFPEPEKFDPERFSEENKSELFDGTWIPFGSGPRNCIGMRFAMIQAKIALALILLNFELKLSRKTKLPLNMETKGIILTPIGGLWIKFTKLRPQ